MIGASYAPGREQAVLLDVLEHRQTCSYVNGFTRSTHARMACGLDSRFALQVTFLLSHWLCARELSLKAGHGGSGYYTSWLAI